MQENRFQRTNSRNHCQVARFASGQSLLVSVGSVRDGCHHSQQQQTDQDLWIFQQLQPQQIGLRTSWTYRVGDRGTPTVEGQVRGQQKTRVAIVESTKLRLRGAIWIVTFDVQASDSIDNVKHEAGEIDALDSTNKAQIRRAHSLEIEVCKRIVSVKHPEKSKSLPWRKDIDMSRVDVHNLSTRVLEEIMEVVQIVPQERI